jgi:hypothetical protein
MKSCVGLCNYIYIYIYIYILQIIEHSGEVSPEKKILIRKSLYISYVGH